MFDAFLFACKKLLNELILMKQKVKGHDEQIIVAKLRQEMFKR